MASINDAGRIIDSRGNIVNNHTKYAHLFEDKRKSDISIETFYQLLIAEMTNQDPMDPMSNTEFVSQMAAFTSLQVQQEALYYNNSNYAQSMVGKTVIVASSTGSGMNVQTGPVTRVNFTGGEFQVTVNGREYPLKNVMEVLDHTNGIASRGAGDGAFATSLIGKYVTIGLVNDRGVPVVEEGIVERVEIKDGEISIIIDNIAYPLYSVAKIETNDANNKNNKTDDDLNQPGGVIIDPDDDDE